MRLPWQAREYERTCADCGYTWRVPRSAVRRRPGAISMFTVATVRSVDRAELAREVDSISAQNEPAEAFRHCPKCDSEHFRQRALRGRAS